MLSPRCASAGNMRWSDSLDNMLRKFKMTHQSGKAREHRIRRVIRSAVPADERLSGHKHSLTPTLTTPWSLGPTGHAPGPPSGEERTKCRTGRGQASERPQPASVQKQCDAECRNPRKRASLPKVNNFGYLSNTLCLSLSRVRLLATPGTVAHHASLSMGLSRQEYWSGLPFPSAGDFSDPGIEPRSPTLQADSLPSKPQGSPFKNTVLFLIIKSYSNSLMV